MHITHSYLGSVKGNSRYSFYLLYEDYIQAQSKWVSDLDVPLERFARNIGHSGVVIKPFLGDVETTKNHVLSKKWELSELKEIQKTPGLLIIDKDFDDFEPRTDSWLYLNFGETLYETPIPIGTYEDVLTRFAGIVTDSKKDLFKEAKPIIEQLKLLNMAEMFEAKPGIFGFCIDLKKASNYIIKKLGSR